MITFSLIGPTTFIIAILITLLSIPIIQKVAIKRKLLDMPEPRKVHQVPTPRIGGIALYLGICITSVVLWQSNASILTMMIGGSLIFLIGIIDDIINIPPRNKLVFQIIIASLTYLMGLNISFITSPLGGLLYLNWASFPLTIFWIVGLTNALNIIDGIDGLAAGVAGISATMLSIVAILNGQYAVACFCLIILGSCLGFLNHNFAPAKIFMGDSGAMLLGYLLACISITGVMKSTTTFSLIVPILMLGIPISDTAYAIIRRLKNNQHVFKADFDHFHHKLLKQGFSVKQISMGFYCLSFIFGLFAICIRLSSGIVSYVVLLITILFAVITGAMFKKRSRIVRIALNFFI